MVTSLTLQMLASHVRPVAAVLDSTNVTLPSSQSSPVQCFSGWMLPTLHCLPSFTTYGHHVRSCREPREMAVLLLPLTLPPAQKASTANLKQTTRNQLHSMCTPEHTPKTPELQLLFTDCRADITIALLKFIKIKDISQCKRNISRISTASPQSLAMVRPPPLSNTGTLVSSFSKRKLLA